MDVYWTVKAQGDLERLLSGSFGLAGQPAMGIQQARYLPRDVRKIVMDDYEIHYELKNAAIFIVDLWHTKEER
ncbi:type II toxin-antitoxin system RelE/ParE family toxin [Pseudocitrobacter corydidari]